MRSSHASPPARLESALEIDPADWTKADVYDLVTALVVPRPVAWVSTIAPDGRRNLAPHSYFNLVSDDPPHVMFSSVGVKDTLRNVRATREFVVNIASQDVLDALDATAAELPYGDDEFAFAGLSPVAARRVAPPRVAQARAHLECALAHELAVGNCNVVIGRVLHVHVDASIWCEGRVAPQLLDPVVRLSRRYGGLREELTPEEEPSPHVLA